MTSSEKHPDRSVESPPTATSGPTTGRRPRRFSWRGFTSLLLSGTFLAMCVSGTMLFLSPRGRVANWTNWSLVGLGKHDWSAVHMNNSLLFAAAVALHLTLNWSVFLRYIKHKAVAGVNLKRELALAAAVTMVGVAGPVAGVLPFRHLVALNEQVKDYWERWSDPAPLPHAEEMQLGELAASVNLTYEQLAGALREGGYEVMGPQQTIGDLARPRHLAPSDVFALVRQRFPDSHGWGRIGTRGAGAGHPQGTGMGARLGGGSGLATGMAPDLRGVTIAALAHEVRLTPDEVVAALVADGWTVDSPSMTLGQLSDQTRTSPADVIQSIRRRFPDARGWGRLLYGGGGKGGPGGFGR